MWDRLQYMFTIKSQKSLNDLAHHHNLILKDLNLTQPKKEKKGECITWGIGTNDLSHFY